MQVTVRVEIEALGQRAEAVVEEHVTTEQRATEVASTAAVAAKRAWVDARRRERA